MTVPDQRADPVQDPVPRDLRDRDKCAEGGQKIRHERLFRDRIPEPAEPTRRTPLRVLEQLRPEHPDADPGISGQGAQDEVPGHHLVDERVQLRAHRRDPAPLLIRVGELDRVEELPRVLALAQVLPDPEFRADQPLLRQHAAERPLPGGAEMPDPSPHP